MRSICTVTGERCVGVNVVNFSQAREAVNMTCTTSIDAMFKRKRGRPPKNRVIEVGVTIYWSRCPAETRASTKIS